MDEFLDQNLRTYRALAGEYEKRISEDFLNDLPLVFRIWSHIERRYGGAAKLLDLGCGHGVNVAMFARLGARAMGLDFSPEMIDVARRLNPASEFINDEFLHADLGPAMFDVVFAKAFIHLFPLAACDRVFRKIHRILKPRGLLYVATTWSEHSSEGYQVKADYAGEHQRFRRIWSHEELCDFSETQGFRLLEQWENTEPHREKRWFNLIAEVQHG